MTEGQYQAALREEIAQVMHDCQCGGCVAWAAHSEPVKAEYRADADLVLPIVARELAARDAEIEQIRALAQGWWKLAMDDGRATQYREGRADGFARCATDAERLLSSLPSTGETNNG